MKIQLSIPSSGDVAVDTLGSIVGAVQSSSHKIGVATACGSLLTTNFNRLYCWFLNGTADYFVMLHADIAPQGVLWLDRFVEIAQENKAAILSGVVALGDHSRLTSTAEDIHRWAPRKLSIDEVLAMPLTWPASSEGKRYVFNTGFLLIDRTVGPMGFTMRDALCQDQSGQWQALVQPEDWHFSRRVIDAGHRCFITREIVTLHRRYFWSNGAVTADRYKVGQLSSDPIAWNKFIEGFEGNYLPIE